MAEFKRFNPNDRIKPFNCGNDDLNGFLLEDNSSVSNAKHHANELLAVTYIVEDKEADKTIAYFSLLNDKIERYFADETEWRYLSKRIPNSKRRKSHPAVKLGRLAVSLDYQHKKWGTNILNFLKYWFVNNNKTGCRFITVDALIDKVGFYEKEGFKVLVPPKEDEDTVLMYYDLKRLSAIKK